MNTFNTLILYVSFTLFCNILEGQTFNDTLVLKNELNYSNKAEESFFNTIIKSETPDYLSAFLASSGKSTENEIDNSVIKYRDFLKTLNIEKINAYNSYKKIKVIYKAVHNNFFSKYELQTSFEQIFNGGIYNCVSATALYGVILSDLKIPYVIIETPTHVYLVAYPEKEEIKIETTDPTSGYLVMDQKSKKAFIDHLHVLKLISDNEFLTTNTDKLFNKYYYADNKIHLKELLALDYLNLAIYNLADRKNEESYSCLEKSYFLYPTERTRYLMIITLIETIKNIDYEKADNLNYLVKLSRFTSLGIAASDIVNEFLKITNQQLINKSNIDFYDEAYNYLYSNLKNKEHKDEISYIYYFERGRYLLNKGQHTESMEWFGKAYQLKPQNADVQNAFVQSIALSLNQMTGSEAISKLEDYISKYNNLQQNKTFIRLLLHAYLISAYEHFSMQQPVSGCKELENFEELFENNRELDIFQETIADAYASAGIYYFRKSNYKKAREYIDKGLEYAPGNFKLIMSRNSF